MLALGTWAFGGDWGSFDKAEAESAIDLALDQGITLFDTAQGYGFGVAERLLGERLWKRVRRDEVMVATKGGLRMDGATLVRDASAALVAGGCGGQSAQPGHRLHRSLSGALAGSVHPGRGDRRRPWSSWSARA